MHQSAALPPGSNGQPSPTGGNGRSPDGRFLPGNKLAKGNPHNKKVQQIRAALFEAVTKRDAKKIAKVIVQKAINGDLAAAKEFFDRTIGRAAQSDVLERLAGLEDRVNALLGRDSQ